MTREEVTAELGIDSSNIERGLGVGLSYAQKWTQQVKGQEQQYTQWWNTELKRREDMEVDAAVRAATRANRARALLRERAEARTIAQNAEQAAANDMMAAGSVPEAWAAKKAAIELEKKAAEGLKDVAESSHASAGAMREVAVIVREGIRGNWTRMIGSVSILLQRLGMNIGSLGGAAIAAAGALWILYEARQMREAQEQEMASTERNLNMRGSKMFEAIEGQIKGMQAMGKLDQGTAAQYLKLINDSPSLSTLTQMAKRLQPLGGVGKHDPEEAARLDEEHKKKMLEYQREDMDNLTRLYEDENRRLSLAHAMATMEKSSIDYKKMQLDYDEAARDVQEDKKKLAEETADKQRIINQEQRVYDEAALHIKEIEQHDRERFMPTLQELARSGGAGGRGARQIERLERRIRRDFVHGDTAGADALIGQRNKLYDSLAARGFLPERTEQREIKNLTAEMRLHLKRIAEGQAILKMKGLIS